MVFCVSAFVLVLQLLLYCDFSGEMCFCHVTNWNLTPAIFLRGKILVVRIPNSGCKIKHISFYKVFYNHNEMLFSILSNMLGTSITLLASQAYSFNLHRVATNVILHSLHEIEFHCNASSRSMVQRNRLLTLFHLFASHFFYQLLLGKELYDFLLLYKGKGAMVWN